MIDIDDEYGRRLAAPTAPCRSSPSARPAAATRTGGPTTSRSSADGTQTFTPSTPHGGVPAGCALPGPFNVANALLALACLDAVGRRRRELAAPALRRRGGARAGCSGSTRGQDFLAVVDYAHKPAALSPPCSTRCGRTPTGRLIVVLGAGGDRDRASAR